MPPPSDFAKGLQVPRILWAAFVGAHVVISAVFWLQRTQAESLPEPPPDVLVYVLVGMGVLLPLSTPGVRGVLMAKAGAALADQQPATLLGAYFVPLIISFALCESATLFGCVLLQLGADPMFWAIPAAMGFGFHLISLPTVSKLETWQQTLAGRR